MSEFFIFTFSLQLDVLTAGKERQRRTLNQITLLGEYTNKAVQVSTYYTIIT